LPTKEKMGEFPPRIGERQQYQHFEYEHHGNNVSRAAVEKLALDGISVEGGLIQRLWSQQGSPDILR
jgi:hypothetical protein